MLRDEHEASRVGRELRELLQETPPGRLLSIAVVEATDGCAGARGRDIEVVLGPGAIHIRVGAEGSAGEPAPLLASVKGERLLLEHVVAFAQLFVLERRPRETVTGFVRRSGIDYVRERVSMDPVGRGQLFRQFERARRAGKPPLCPAKVTAIRRVLADR